MRDISTFDTRRTDPVVVAWLDQFGHQVSFIAARGNDGHWYANGTRIGAPTHWEEVPQILATQVQALG